MSMVNSGTAFVIYAEPQLQWVIPVNLGAEPMTVREALAKTAGERPVRSHALGVGLNGQWANLEDVLKSGDRVELYRPLKLDPMEMRRRRALQQKRALEQRQQTALKK